MYMYEMSAQKEMRFEVLATAMTIQACVRQALWIISILSHQLVLVPAGQEFNREMEVAH